MKPSYARIVTHESRFGGRWLGPLFFGCCCLLAGSAFAFWFFHPKPKPEPVPPVLPPAPEPERSAFERLVFPTDQDILAGRGKPGTFMPTNPEHPDSGLFGSVRTAASRQGEVASFHEGVDIAPLRRDRKGQPLDSVCAMADGKVAYVNRKTGNSNYGNYIVLLHSDPVGSVYSLYAHLSVVDGEVKVGQTVSAGTVLGTMGHTSNRGIPLHRAHVHIEMGLISNARFPQWFREQRLKPDHGTYNGWNLFAVNSLDVFDKQRSAKNFTFQQYLEGIPPAFEVVLNVRRLPDYFERYPRLWTGSAFAGGAIVLRCSEDGLPLGGRQATDQERAALGNRPVAVLSVDETVLGRNGMHIVGRSNGGWVLASGSKRWLEILTY